MGNLSDLRRRFNQRRLITNIKSRSPSPSFSRPSSRLSGHSFRPPVRLVSTTNTSAELGLPHSRDQLLKLFRKSTSPDSPRRQPSPVPLTYRQSAAALLYDRISKYFYKHLSRWKRFVQLSKATEQEMTSYKRASQIRISVSSISPIRSVKMPRISDKSRHSAAFKRQEDWKEVSFSSDMQSSLASVEVVSGGNDLSRRIQSSFVHSSPQHIRILTPLEDDSPLRKTASSADKTSMTSRLIDELADLSEMSNEATLSFLLRSLKEAGASRLNTELVGVRRRRLMTGFHCIYAMYTRSVAAAAQFSYLTKARLRSLKAGFEAVKIWDETRPTKEGRMMRSLLRLTTQHMPRHPKASQLRNAFDCLSVLHGIRLRDAWTSLRLARFHFRLNGLVLPTTQLKGRYGSVVCSIDGPAVKPSSQMETHLENCLDIYKKHLNFYRRDALHRWKTSKANDFPIPFKPDKAKALMAPRILIATQALTRLRNSVLSRQYAQLISKLQRCGSTSQLKVKALQLLLKNLHKDAQFREKAAFEQWRLAVRQEEADILRTIAMTQSLAQLRQGRKLLFLQCLKAAARRGEKAVDIRSLFKLMGGLQTRRLRLMLQIWRSNTATRPYNGRGAVALVGAVRLLLKKRLDSLFMRQVRPWLEDWINPLQIAFISKTIGGYRRLTKAFRVMKALMRQVDSRLKLSKLQAFSSWRSAKSRPSKLKTAYMTFVLGTVASKSTSHAWQQLKFTAVNRSSCFKNRQQASRNIIVVYNTNLTRAKASTLQLWRSWAKEDRHLESLEIVLKDWGERRVQKTVIKSWNKSVTKAKHTMRGLELIGKLYRSRLDDYYQTFSVPCPHYSDSPLRTPPRMSIARQSKVIALRELHSFITTSVRSQLKTALNIWRGRLRPKQRRFTTKFVLAAISKLTRLAEFVNIKHKELTYWAYMHLKSGRVINQRHSSLMRNSIANWINLHSTNSRRVVECFRLWKRKCRLSLKSTVWLGRSGV